MTILTQARRRLQRHPVPMATTLRDSFALLYAVDTATLSTFCPPDLELETIDSTSGKLGWSPWRRSEPRTYAFAAPVVDGQRFFAHRLSSHRSISIARRNCSPCATNHSEPSPQGHVPC